MLEVHKKTTYTYTFCGVVINCPSCKESDKMDYLFEDISYLANVQFECKCGCSFHIDKETGVINVINKRV